MKTLSTRIKHFLLGSDEFRKKLDELDRVKLGLNLDSRVDGLYHAALNGDTEWFLTLLSKNPECAFEIARKCEDKK